MTSVIDLIDVTAPGPEPQPTPKALPKEEPKTYEPVHASVFPSDELYKRVMNKWKRLTTDDISGLKIRDVIWGPYAFKIRGRYYIGSDETYFILKDKEPEWIHETINYNLKSCIREGVSWKILMDSPFSIAYITGPRILHIEI